MFKDNRAGDARDSCEIVASILLEADHEPIPCVVVDISEAGARLIVAASIALPDRFILALPLIEDHCDERHVDIRWREADIVGVRFLGDVPAKSGI